MKRTPRRAVMVEVGQGLRHRVAKVLGNLGTTRCRGFTDASATTVRFTVLTALPTREVQDTIWGSEGLGSIWCSVSEVKS